MTFFLVLLAVMAVIVGNLMWLRPSARDRALVAQRTQAQAAGFAVHLRVAPEWLQLPPGQRLVGHYHLPLSVPEARRGRWRWQAGLGNWQPVAKPEAWLAPPPWPVPAPAGWLGTEARAEGITVYWREDGHPDSVARMKTQLLALAA